MNKKALSKEELQRRIERLRSFRNTPHEHRTDKRYIKMYETQLNMTNSPDNALTDN